MIFLYQRKTRRRRGERPDYSTQPWQGPPFGQQIGILYHNYEHIMDIDPDRESHPDRV